MPEHLPYYKLSPQTYQNQLATSKSIRLEPRLKHLIDLRVSQINGCVYCINMHTHEALTDGESQRRLTLVAGWREAGDVFTPAERAALAWAEALTRLADSGGPEHEEREKTYNALSNHYTPEQIADIGFTIATINAWNRLAVGFYSPLSR
jgi:AhpD family alkylhydroperoxidase